MSEFWNWVSWLGYILAWLPVAWTALAMAIAVPWIICDEVRIRRTAPKPAEVVAHADHVEALHGADGLGVVGDAMTEALQCGDFQTRRFLKEVSQELARRRFSKLYDNHHEIL